MSKMNKGIQLFRIKSLITAVIILLPVLGISTILFFSFKSHSHTSSNNLPTFTVKKGPLTISVTEAGTIKAREQIILKNEVEGKTSILWLVREGTQVKKGDLLVELDASQSMDKKIDQQIRVQNAEAAFVNARENLAVVKNQAQSDINEAKLTLDFAEQDLKKYIEGEYPNDLNDSETKITLAQEELTRAEEKLKWSKTLFQEKYVSQSELQADELAAKRKASELESAKNNLHLLKNFTHQRTLAQLKSDVTKAEMALERANRKAGADIVQAEAELKAKESEFKRQKDKLAKIERQIEKTKIYAPADGLVIYASSAQSMGQYGFGGGPLAEGMEIRERQELIYLPTGSTLKAEIDVHEMNLKKVRAGLPVRVTAEALPMKCFTGRMAMIAPLPSSQRAYLNPDSKVYKAEVYIEEESDLLRTGMSCMAEIIIAHYNEAIFIPVQAVLRVGGHPTVYVVNGKDTEPRKVEVGFDNNRMTHIISGLQPDEEVLLTPPLASGTVEAQPPFTPPPSPGNYEEPPASMPPPDLGNYGEQPPSMPPPSSGSYGEQPPSMPPPGLGSYGGQPPSMPPQAPDGYGGKQRSYYGGQPLSMLPPPPASGVVEPAKTEPSER